LIVPSQKTIVEGLCFLGYTQSKRRETAMEVLTLLERVTLELPVELMRSVRLVAEKTDAPIGSVIQSSLAHTLPTPCHRLTIFLPEKRLSLPHWPFLMMPNFGRLRGQRCPHNPKLNLPKCLPDKDDDTRRHPIGYGFALAGSKWGFMQIAPFYLL